MTWEIDLINQIGNWRTPFWNGFFSALTDFGSTKFIIFFAFIACVIFFVWRRYYDLAFLAAALCGQEIIVTLLKHMIGRARPEVIVHLVEASGFSFPSGHSTASIVFYGAMAYILTRDLKNGKVAAWSAAAVLILLIGFSRVYLGVHWPTDVLGGFAIGATWLAIVVFVFEKKMIEWKS